MRSAGFALCGRQGYLTDKAIWGRGCLRSCPYALKEVILICQPRIELWSVRGLWVVHPTSGGSLIRLKDLRVHLRACARRILKKQTCGRSKPAMNWDAAACVGGKNSLRNPSCSTCGPLGSILPTTETLHLMWQLHILTFCDSQPICHHMALFLSC